MHSERLRDDFMLLQQCSYAGACLLPRLRHHTAQPIWYDGPAGTLCTEFNSHYLAGTLFWKWGLSPKNPRTDYLEVAVPDPTFTDIVVPGAKAALNWAKNASPLKNCQNVRTSPLPPDALWGAWRRLKPGSEPSAQKALGWCYVQVRARWGHQILK